MVRVVVTALLSVLLVAGKATESDAQKRCTKGIPCGNTCISRDKVCRIGPSSPTSSSGNSAPEEVRATSYANAQFVASVRGTVYYPVGCRAAQKLAPANRVYFQTAEQAQAAGYRATTNRACSTRSATAKRRWVAPAMDGGSCTVRSVTDGDTFACTDGRRVRLLLLDAPEINQPPYGHEARKELARMLTLGSVVHLEYDLEKQDRYGRALAYVHLPDGRMANEEMVRAGYAVVSVYPPNVQYVERMRAAARAAQEARRGLWATPAFECQPADFRAGRCR